MRNFVRRTGWTGLSVSRCFYRPQRSANTARGEARPSFHSKTFRFVAFSRRNPLLSCIAAGGQSVQISVPPHLISPAKSCCASAARNADAVRKQAHSEHWCRPEKINANAGSEKREESAATRASTATSETCFSRSRFTVVVRTCPTCHVEHDTIPSAAHSLTVSVASNLTGITYHR